jgi:hypothetical protein
MQGLGAASLPQTDSAVKAIAGIAKFCSILKDKIVSE